MRTHFGSEQDYKEFKTELRARLDRHRPREIQKPEFHRAAVMMLLLNKDGEAHVLLTKRTEKVATHKGQVSFPGGRHDAGDADLLQTALRETGEEVGIPRSDIEVLGRFDDFISIAGFHVVTFVGVIPHPYSYVLNRDEIEDYLEAPLSLFVNRQYEKVEHIMFEGNRYSVYYYFFNGFDIWGLTARILTDFAAKILNGRDTSSKGRSAEFV